MKYTTAPNSGIYIKTVKYGDMFCAISDLSMFYHLNQNILEIAFRSAFRKNRTVFKGGTNFQKKPNISVFL